ncbi:DoxX family protein [Flavobacterium microcysteis]|uniref:DoxX family membrane protein n=1 Tax=Flavobacterium microcysteis TaxID=2596891 RepID=A0A501Q4H1_9FLAO|nr:DoxX family protein [Flavobacterium microcysteis]TPD66926.1 DoxX family membrane protein [Flavobacterium microcysteis]
MKKAIQYSVAGLAIILGAFFVYKGLNKHFLSECKVYEADSPLPLNYRNLITALCTSGFTKVVGFLEIASGILLIIPRTRLLGSIVLLPVIITIFLFHLLIDNRPHELVETGIPLLAAILVFASYYNVWKVIVAGRKN